MDAITRRPEEPGDEAFLLAQFRLQALHYRSHYPGAEFHIVLHQGRCIGRLYVHRGTNEIRLMDITLIPEYRGRGFGRRLLESVLDAAIAIGKPITAYVERN